MTALNVPPPASVVRESRIRQNNATVSAALENSSLPPLLQRLYANRGVASPDAVDYRMEHLLDYRSMKDIEVAAALIARHVVDGNHIVIIGDFDADGATSSALMVRALSAMGGKRISYLVPNRFDYGYGLSPEIVALAAERQPDLIITVDNGIASIEGVAAANQRGIEVVITDHHLPAQTLPAAAAIVNPNQPGCTFPGKHTAGVGVAFYVMLAVRAALRGQDWFESSRHPPSQPNMAALLDLVALGTVADVVPLDDNNRLLVELGLRRIRRGQGCAGINALLEIAGRNPAQCRSQEFGFVVGPRLNAAGRIEDMSIGIECLLTDDPGQAQRLAARLNEINLQRRQIEAEMLFQAENALQAALDRLAAGAAGRGASITLFHADWHQGVVGLLASRVKEKWHRPVIAFARAGQGELKGSGRSIPGLHLRDVLDRVTRREPDLILKFGGHAMAAGLSIRENDLARFERCFEQAVADSLLPGALTPVEETDGDLPPEWMTLEMATLIDTASPWGQGFPAPRFDAVFDVLEWRIVGQKHLKMILQPPGTTLSLSAIAFNTTDRDLPDEARARMVYRLDVNVFREQRQLQLVIEYIEALTVGVPDGEQVGGEQVESVS